MADQVKFQVSSEFSVKGDSKWNTRKQIRTFTAGISGSTTLYKQVEAYIKSTLYKHFKKDIIDYITVEINGNLAKYFDKTFVLLNSYYVELIKDQLLPWAFRSSGTKTASGYIGARQQYGVYTGSLVNSFVADTRRTMDTAALYNSEYGVDKKKNHIVGVMSVLINPTIRREYSTALANGQPPAIKSSEPVMRYALQYLRARRQAGGGMLWNEVAIVDNIQLWLAKYALRIGRHPKTAAEEAQKLNRELADEIIRLRQRIKKKIEIAAENRMMNREGVKNKKREEPKKLKTKEQQLGEKVKHPIEVAGIDDKKQPIEVAGIDDKKQPIEVAGIDKKQPIEVAGFDKDKAPRKAGGDQEGRGQRENPSIKTKQDFDDGVKRADEFNKKTNPNLRTNPDQARLQPRGVPVGQRLRPVKEDDEVPDNPLLKPVKAVPDQFRATRPEGGVYNEKAAKDWQDEIQRQIEGLPNEDIADVAPEAAKLALAVIAGASQMAGIPVEEGLKDIGLSIQPDEKVADLFNQDKPKIDGTKFNSTIGPEGAKNLAKDGHPEYLAALKKAKKYDGDPDTMRKETGWDQNPDTGDYFIEIPDGRLNEGVVQDLIKNKKGSRIPKYKKIRQDRYNDKTKHKIIGVALLGELISNPILFRAYPQLKRLPVRFEEEHKKQPLSYAGYASVSDKVDEDDDYIDVVVKNPDKPLTEDQLKELFKTIGLHEPEHVIQQLEGRTPGEPDNDQDVILSGDPARKLIDKVIQPRLAALDNIIEGLESDDGLNVYRILGKTPGQRDIVQDVAWELDPDGGNDKKRAQQIVDLIPAQIGPNPQDKWPSFGGDIKPILIPLLEKLFKAKKQYDDMLRNPKPLLRIPHKIYYKLRGGERDARNVENRHKLNREERKNTPFDSTADVPFGIYDKDEPARAVQDDDDNSNGTYYTWEDLDLPQLPPYWSDPKQYINKFMPQNPQELQGDVLHNLNPKANPYTYKLFHKLYKDTRDEVAGPFSQDQIQKELEGTLADKLLPKTKIVPPAERAGTPEREKTVKQPEGAKEKQLKDVYKLEPPEEVVQPGTEVIDVDPESIQYKPDDRREEGITFYSISPEKATRQRGDSHINTYPDAVKAVADGEDPREVFYRTGWQQVGDMWGVPVPDGKLKVRKYAVDGKRRAKSARAFADHVKDMIDKDALPPLYKYYIPEKYKQNPKEYWDKIINPVVEDMEAWAKERQDREDKVKEAQERGKKRVADIADNRQKQQKVKDDLKQIQQDLKEADQDLDYLKKEPTTPPEVQQEAQDFRDDLANKEKLVKRQLHNLQREEKQLIDQFPKDKIDYDRAKQKLDNWQIEEESFLPPKAFLEAEDFQNNLAASSTPMDEVMLRQPITSIPMREVVENPILDASYPEYAKGIVEYRPGYSPMNKATTGEDSYEGSGGFGGHAADKSRSSQQPIRDASDTHPILGLHGYGNANPYNFGLFRPKWQSRPRISVRTLPHEEKHITDAFSGEDKYFRKTLGQEYGNNPNKHAYIKGPAVRQLLNRIARSTPEELANMLDPLLIRKRAVVPAIINAAYPYGGDPHQLRPLIREWAETQDPDVARKLYDIDQTLPDAEKVKLHETMQEVHTELRGPSAHLLPKGSVDKLPVRSLKQAAQDSVEDNKDKYEKIKNAAKKLLGEKDPIIKLNGRQLYKLDPFEDRAFIVGRLAYVDPAYRDSIYGDDVSHSLLKLRLHGDATNPITYSNGFRALPYIPDNFEEVTEADYQKQSPDVQEAGDAVVEGIDPNQLGEKIDDVFEQGGLLPELEKESQIPVAENLFSAQPTSAQPTTAQPTSAQPTTAPQKGDPDLYLKNDDGSLSDAPVNSRGEATPMAEEMGKVKGSLLSLPPAVGPDGKLTDSGKNIVAITKNGDKTTIIHEIGHAVLEWWRKLKQQGKLKGPAAKAFDTIMDTFGGKGVDWSKPVTDPDTLNKLTDAQERWATALEGFFKDGKARSAPVRDAMREVGKWFKETYGDVTPSFIRSDGVREEYKPNPAIEDVMNSILENGFPVAEVVNALSYKPNTSSNKVVPSPKLVSAEANETPVIFNQVRSSFSPPVKSTATLQTSVPSDNVQPAYQYVQVQDPTGKTRFKQKDAPLRDGEKVLPGEYVKLPKGLKNPDKPSVLPVERYNKYINAGMIPDEVVKAITTPESLGTGEPSDNVQPAYQYVPVQDSTGKIRFKQKDAPLRDGEKVLPGEYIKLPKGLKNPDKPSVMSAKRYNEYVNAGLIPDEIIQTITTPDKVSSNKSKVTVTPVVPAWESMPSQSPRDIMQKMADRLSKLARNGGDVDHNGLLKPIVFQDLAKDFQNALLLQRVGPSGIDQIHKLLDPIRKQYAGKPGYLKAPNGKPSNLTEISWLYTRMPSFKKFFGDWENDPKNASKIVDANGEPLVVWRVTTEDSPRMYDGGGIFFGKEPTNVYSYTKGDPTIDLSHHMRPFFVNMRNPFAVDALGSEWSGLPLGFGIRTHIPSSSGYVNKATALSQPHMDGFSLPDSVIDDILSRFIGPDQDWYEESLGEDLVNSLEQQRKQDESDGMDPKDFMQVSLTDGNGQPFVQSYSDTLETVLRRLTNHLQDLYGGIVNVDELPNLFEQVGVMPRIKTDFPVDKYKSQPVVNESDLVEDFETNTLLALVYKGLLRPPASQNSPYDGVIVSNVYDASDIDVIPDQGATVDIMALVPEQVKSADRNNGEFGFNDELYKISSGGGWGANDPFGDDPFGEQADTAPTTYNKVTSPTGEDRMIKSGDPIPEGYTESPDKNDYTFAQSTSNPNLKNFMPVNKFNQLASKGKVKPAKNPDPQTLAPATNEQGSGSGSGATTNSAHADKTKDFNNRFDDLSDQLAKDKEQAEQLSNELLNEGYKKDAIEDKLNQTPIGTPEAKKLFKQLNGVKQKEKDLQNRLSDTKGKIADGKNKLEKLALDATDNEVLLQPDSLVNQLKPEHQGTLKHLLDVMAKQAPVYLKRLWNLGASDLKLEDADGQDAYYDPATGTLCADWDNPDVWRVRPNGELPAFHEVEHRADDVLQKNPESLKYRNKIGPALKKDFDNLIHPKKQEYLKQGLSDEDATAQAALDAVRDARQKYGDNIGALFDVLDGQTGGKLDTLVGSAPDLQGVSFGHGEAYYNDPNKAVNEAIPAFIHPEAVGNFDATKALNEAFPNASKAVHDYMTKGTEEAYGLPQSASGDITQPADFLKTPASNKAMVPFSQQAFKEAQQHGKLPADAEYPKDVSELYKNTNTAAWALDRNKGRAVQQKFNQKVADLESNMGGNTGQPSSTVQRAPDHAQATSPVYADSAQDTKVKPDTKEMAASDMVTATNKPPQEQVAQAVKDSANAPKPSDEVPNKFVRVSDPQGKMSFKPEGTPLKEGEKLVDSNKYIRIPHGITDPKHPAMISTQNYDKAVNEGKIPKVEVPKPEPKPSDGLPRFQQIQRADGKTGVIPAGQPVPKGCKVVDRTAQGGIVKRPAGYINPKTGDASKPLYTTADNYDRDYKDGSLVSGLTNEGKAQFAETDPNFNKQFDDYIATGEASTPKFKAAFDDFKKWLGSLFEPHLKGIDFMGEDGRLHSYKLKNPKLKGELEKDFWKDGDTGKSPNAKGIQRRNDIYKALMKVRGADASGNPDFDSNKLLNAQEIKEAAESIEKLRTDVQELNKTPETATGVSEGQVTAAALDWAKKSDHKPADIMYKVLDAVKLCKRFNLDPSKFGSPDEVLNSEYAKKVRDKDTKFMTPEDLPDQFKQCFTNKKEYPNGLVIYDIDDSTPDKKWKAMRAVRGMVDSQWGKNASPWCLISRVDEDGMANFGGEDKDKAKAEYLKGVEFSEEGNWLENDNMLRNAMGRYWDYYNRYTKQIAFKNGKLVAFNANKDTTHTWWDRQDKPGDPDVVYKEKRVQSGQIDMVEFDTNVGEDRLLTREDTKAGEYREFYKLPLGLRSELKDAGKSSNIVNRHISSKDNTSKVFYLPVVEEIKDVVSNKDTDISEFAVAAVVDSATHMGTVFDRQGNKKATYSLLDSRVSLFQKDGSVGYEQNADGIKQFNSKGNCIYTRSSDGGCEQYYDSDGNLLLEYVASENSSNSGKSSTGGLIPKFKIEPKNISSYYPDGTVRSEIDPDIDSYTEYYKNGQVCKYVSSALRHPANSMIQLYDKDGSLLFKGSQRDTPSDLICKVCPDDTIRTATVVDKNGHTSFYEDTLKDNPSISLSYATDNQVYPSQIRLSDGLGTVTESSFAQGFSLSDRISKRDEYMHGSNGFVSARGYDSHGFVMTEGVQSDVDAKEGDLENVILSRDFRSQSLYLIDTNSTLHDSDSQLPSLRAMHIFDKQQVGSLKDSKTNSQLATDYVGLSRIDVTKDRDFPGEGAIVEAYAHAHDSSYSTSNQKVVTISPRNEAVGYDETGNVRVKQFADGRVQYYNQNGQTEVDVSADGKHIKSYYPDGSLMVDSVDDNYRRLYASAGNKQSGDTTKGKQGQLLREQSSDGSISFNTQTKDGQSVKIGFSSAVDAKRGTSTINVRLYDSENPSRVDKELSYIAKDPQRSEGTTSSVDPVIKTYNKKGDQYEMRHPSGTLELRTASDQVLKVQSGNQANRDKYVEHKEDVDNMIKSLSTESINKEHSGTPLEAYVQGKMRFNQIPLKDPTLSAFDHAGNGLRLTVPKSELPDDQLKQRKVYDNLRLAQDQLSFRRSIVGDYSLCRKHQAVADQIMKAQSDAQKLTQKDYAWAVSGSGKDRAIVKVNSWGSFFEEAPHLEEIPF